MVYQGQLLVYHGLVLVYHGLVLVYHGLGFSSFYTRGTENKKNSSLQPVKLWASPTTRLTPVLEGHTTILV